MQTVFFAEPDVTERSVDAAAAATPLIKNQACNVAQSLAKIGRSASASGLLTPVAYRD
jgi:hypothetical protein